MGDPQPPADAYPDCDPVDPIEFYQNDEAEHDPLIDREGDNLINPDTGLLDDPGLFGGRWQQLV
ncbi:MAG: hypothetical protein R3E50_03250 [Halioglobus sp.]